VPFVEIQVSEVDTLAIVEAAASLAPNPLGNVSFLDSGQYIRSVQYVAGSISFAAADPFGAVQFSQQATLNVVTFDQLAADPQAPGKDHAAILDITVAIVNKKLELAFTGIAIDGSHFSFPVPYILQRIAVTGGLSFGALGSLNILGGAVLHDSDASLVIARFATSVAELMGLTGSPLVDRRAVPSDTSWAVFLAGDMLAGALQGVLGVELAAALPPNVVVDVAPEATWGAIGPDALVVNGIGIVDATTHLVALGACPTWLGNMDIGITLDLSVVIVPNMKTTTDTGAVDPNHPQPTLDLRMHVRHSVDKWDGFVCWLTNVVVGGFVPIAGILAGWAATVLLGGVIETQADQDVSGHTLAGITLLDPPDDGDDATYTGRIPVPPLPLPSPPGQAPNSVIASPAGITMSGPLFVPDAVASHAVVATPASLDGAWNGSFDCSQNDWVDQYLLPPLTVSDSCTIPFGSPTHPPVTIYHTEVRAATGYNGWEVSVNGPIVQVTWTGQTFPQPGDSATLFLHTSAGVALVPITPVPQGPAAPTPGQIAQGHAGCAQATAPWQAGGRLDFHWIPDPAPWERDALQQWVIDVAMVPSATTLEIVERGPAMLATPRSIRIAGANDRVTVPLTLTPGTELSLSVGGDEAVRGVIHQRFLLPQARVELDAPILDFARLGAGNVAVLTATEVVTFAGGRTLWTRVPSYGATVLKSTPAGVIASGYAGRYLLTPTGLIRASTERAADVGAVTFEADLAFWPRQERMLGLRTFALDSDRVLVGEGTQLVTATPGRALFGVGV